MKNRSARVPAGFLLLLFPLLLAASSAFAFGGSGEGCGAGACSECHSMDRAEAETILAGLVKKVHSVGFSVVPGLWKVEVEGSDGRRGSVYMDFSKSFAISGRVLRLADWMDVSDTEGTEVKERKADLSSLPWGDAPVMGSTKATVKVAVFTDPQCPFCEKLHGEIKKALAARPDVAFHLFFMPLKSHPDAYRISKSIVCSDSLELLEASFAGRSVPDPACETDVIDRFLALAGELGIGSTPTLIFPDGNILSGFKPAEKLLEILERTSPLP